MQLAELVNATNSPTGSRASKILALCFLLALAVCNYLVLRQDPNFLPLAIVAVAACFAGTALVGSKVIWALVGASCMTMPMFGPGALNIVVLAGLIGLLVAGLLPNFKRLLKGAQMISARSSTLLSAAVIVFVIVLSGALNTFASELDSYLLETIWRASGFRGLSSYLWQNLYSWILQIVEIGGYLIAAILLSCFLSASEKPEVVRSFLDGLAIAVPGVVLVLLGQIAELDPLLSMNQSNFWRFVERYSASFSDPNAFGLVAAIVVPALWCSAQKGNYPRFYCYRVASVALMIAGAWSGSRSFWLGLIIFAVSYLVLSKRKATAGSNTYSPSNLRGLKGKSVPIFLLTSFVLVLAAGHPRVNSSLQDGLQRLGGPTGPTRVLKTINWDHFSEMTSNRLLYAKLALAVWKTSPVFGVGQGGFYRQQAQAADKLGLELGDWRDNANNYYLQVLSEQGVVGLLLLLVAFLFVYRSLEHKSILSLENNSRPERIESVFTELSVLSSSLALSSAALFLIGPHLFFEEFRYLLLLLLAVGVSELPERTGVKKRFLHRGLFIVPIVYLGFGFWNSGFKSRGLYAVEHSEGEDYIWTASEAELLFCNTQLVEEIDLRALQPGLERDPLLVSFPETSTDNSLSLTNSDWHKHPVKLHSIGPNLSRLSIKVSRVWSPAGGSAVGDNRWLGVMLKLPKKLVFDGDQCLSKGIIK